MLSDDECVASVGRVTRSDVCRKSCIANFFLRHAEILMIRIKIVTYLVSQVSNCWRFFEGVYDVWLRVPDVIHLRVELFLLVFEVITTVVMKGIFWAATLCSPSWVNRRFGGTRRLHFQGRRISQARNQREGLLATWLTLVSCFALFFDTTVFIVMCHCSICHFNCCSPRLFPHQITYMKFLWALICWVLTIEVWVQYWLTSCEIRSGWNAEVFLDQLIIIPPLLYIHLSPPPEVCDGLEQAAHYNIWVISDPVLTWSHSREF
jgi:hypothetical protein